MVIGINCGHTASGPGYGAIGIIKESEHCQSGRKPRLRLDEHDRRRKSVL